MCRYCKNVVTGDNWEDLLSTEVYLNATDKKKIKFLDVGVGITYGRKLQLAVISNGDELRYVSVPIKYCPMCGTKLKDLKFIEED